jgi:hypothetical protein
MPPLTRGDDVKRERSAGREPAVQVSEEIFQQTFHGAILLSRSAGVFACKFAGRPARRHSERRDAVSTRSRDGRATGAAKRRKSFLKLAGISVN